MNCKVNSHWEDSSRGAALGSPPRSLDARDLAPRKRGQRRGRGDLTTGAASAPTGVPRVRWGVADCFDSLQKALSARHPDTAMLGRQTTSLGNTSVVTFWSALDKPTHLQKDRDCGRCHQAPFISVSFRVGLPRLPGVGLCRFYGTVSGTVGRASPRRARLQPPADSLSPRPHHRL